MVYVVVLCLKDLDDVEVAHQVESDDPLTAAFRAGQEMGSGMRAEAIRSEPLSAYRQAKELLRYGRVA